MPRIRPKQFEKFGDGICKIYIQDEDGKAAKLKECLRFRERTVGFKRFHEAKTNKLQIDRLIRVPWKIWISTEYLVEVEGAIYEIIQTQKITEAKRLVADLSLHLTRQRRETIGKV